MRGQRTGSKIDSHVIPLSLKYSSFFLRALTTVQNTKKYLSAYMHDHVSSLLVFFSFRRILHDWLGDGKTFFYSSIRSKNAILHFDPSGLLLLLLLGATASFFLVIFLLPPTPLLLLLRATLLLPRSLLGPTTAVVLRPRNRCFVFLVKSRPRVVIIIVVFVGGEDCVRARVEVTIAVAEAAVDDGFFLPIIVVAVLMASGGVGAVFLPPLPRDGTAALRDDDDDAARTCLVRARNSASEYLRGPLLPPEDDVEDGAAAAEAVVASSIVGVVVGAKIGDDGNGADDNSSFSGTDSNCEQVLLCVMVAALLLVAETVRSGAWW
jgi:hypothetical protein